VLEGALHHGRDAVELGGIGAAELLLQLGVDRAAVHPDPESEVVLRGHFGDEGDFVAGRLLFLVVVEVARVVTDLVDVRRDLRGEPIVLLEVDDKVRLGDASPDLRQRLDVLHAVDGDPDEAGPCFVEHPNLGDGRLHVLRAGGGHRLHDDRVAAADDDAAGTNGTAGSALHRPEV
jgi:hypothetical protein